MWREKKNCIWKSLWGQIAGDWLIAIRVYLSVFLFQHRYKLLFVDVLRWFIDLWCIANVWPICQFIITFLLLILYSMRQHRCQYAFGHIIQAQMIGNHSILMLWQLQGKLQSNNQNLHISIFKENAINVDLKNKNQHISSFCSGKLDEREKKYAENVIRFRCEISHKM